MIVLGLGLGVRVRVPQDRPALPSGNKEPPEPLKAAHGRFCLWEPAAAPWKLRRRREHNVHFN